MNKVGFGFLGTNLDANGGFNEKRHSAWRPSISFAVDKVLALSRFELWHEPRFLKLANIIKSDIEDLSRTITVNLRETNIRNPWNFEEVYSFLYDFSNEYTFNHDKEEYFVHLTTGTHVAQICLFLLTETRHFPAKLVQSSPRSQQNNPALTIIDLNLSNYDKLARRFEQKLKNDLEILKTGINTRNKEFNRMISEIERVASASCDPILLLGPTGAGKSNLAKQIYLLKKNQNQITGEFVDVNCATIRSEQAMSTLFGHAKGSFTGAQSKREGLLKKAADGILFLDEIGELGADEQAMLLQAVEEKRFFPLGSDQEEYSNFQLIAGTNRDLLQAVRAGSFREDLLHRINTWCFSLPALKERIEDLEPNLEYELKKFEERSGRRITFSSEARSAYLSFATSERSLWPGNFRDLNASVTRMATLAPQGRISCAVVENEIERLKKMWQQPSNTGLGNKDQILRELGAAPETMDLFDSLQLASIVETIKNSGSLAAAGRKLFAFSKQQRTSQNDSDRLRKYLCRFNIDLKKLF